MIKTRARKYDANALYFIKNKQTYAYFNNGFLYLPTVEDKKHFLHFAKIIESWIRLGLLSIGVANIDRWEDHKSQLHFKGTLKKITYEKA